MLALPIFPEITEAQQRRVVGGVLGVPAAERPPRGVTGMGKSYEPRP